MVRIGTSPVRQVCYEVRSVMSLLPTAHAGQSFGSRRIDFFTVSGEVSSSDAGSGRVTDGDGVAHDVRLMERTSALAKGDSATVLRVQSGPNRRSRPVAIVNHSRGLWMRAAPDATSILARSGVTRTLNWWLSVLLLLLVAIAVAWPSLHAFLSELNGAMMSGIPAFNIYSELGAPLPGLASWRLETALSPGLFDGIAALGFIPMEQLTEWGLGVAVAALALIAFFARSWRLVYVPALAVLCVFSGAILGNAVVSLAMIGGAVLLFVIGGFINRVRDGGRFNARVERLAEYVLRHPPEEGVRTSEPTRAGSTTPAPLAAAAAATAIAAASAVAEGDRQDAVAEQDDVPTTSNTPAADNSAAEPAETGANGEVAAEHTETDVATDTPDDDTAPAEPAESGANGEITAEAGNDDQPTPEAAAPAEPQADHDEADDDLPSLDAVAAAAALTDMERTGAGQDVATTTPAASDDDRTMTVAAPPPMPAAPATVTTEHAAEPVAATPPSAPATNETPATGQLVTETMIEAPLPVVTEDDQPAETPSVEAPVADEAASTESASVNDAADPVEAKPVVADIDDPMNEDDGDPMVEKAAGDFAPGAPDIELDREPVD